MHIALFHVALTVSIGYTSSQLHTKLSGQTGGFIGGVLWAGTYVLWHYYTMH